MFGNRKVSDSDSIELGRSPRAAPAPKNNQAYTSVLNSSSHGLFSIEDDEDDDEGEIDLKQPQLELRYIDELRLFLIMNDSNCIQFVIKNPAELS